VNLVVNARDAMPDGGRLTLETRDVDVSPEEARRVSGLVPGRFVAIDVTDTGEGMSEETRSRIFEPFFTTRTGSGGTGLGLATVYGTVQQSGGTIEVESQPARGTNFRIYLPRFEGPEPEISEAVLDESPGGSETLLVVEDEDMLRARMRSMLEARGYTTFQAANGLEALERVEAHDGPLDLVVTDVIMPGMGGIELARRLSELLPDVPILFVSGYTGTAVSTPEFRDSFVLAKPFSTGDLLCGVRRCLDRRESRTEVQP
jgi:CheY-like chemotaxis protein